MNVVGLVSGGKDSCYAMMKCMQYGHQVYYLSFLPPLFGSRENPEKEKKTREKKINGIFGSYVCSPSFFFGLFVHKLMN
jgi:adenylyl- and sulfurtransferase ThiI